MISNNEKQQSIQIDKIEQLIEWGRINEAIKETEQYIQMNPDDSLGYALLAKAYLQGSQLDKALHWSEESLKRDPNDLIAWQIRVLVYFKKDDWDELNQAVQSGKELFPYNSFFYFYETNYFVNKGKFKKAKEEMETCLELEPYDSLNLAFYSYIVSLLGEKGLSESVEKQALELQPNGSSTYLYLGWAAQQRGDFEKELTFFEIAIQSEPSNEQVRSEYLTVLQRKYKLYRFLTFPQRMTKKQALFILLPAFILLKGFALLFLLAYVVMHWVTKLLVHVKVFGWTLPNRN
ncbi:lipopolysaccharide assembly protein LapB [Alkalihalobacillus sp. AL-G]|uniref:tetratricopeptide repeat protein n=1 Tax=Alkalihalobacillus sp. AL-G TaxID=2926399 RepID=UPI00272BBEDB|nr:hypothetical protein [Alkalihalobacillus sp. AL-G]WLD92546.1 hypothetical protein MOJ78_16225 [Alkalihalobacillus sp. AL-G]